MSKEKMCDEDLIEAFRMGDEVSFELLLERYKDLVRNKTKPLYLTGGDREDLIQEGMIGLYKAVRSYDRTKGVPFVAYASMCIENQLRSAIVSACRKKNNPLNEAISYFTMVEKEDGEEYSMDGVLSDNNRSNPEYQVMDEETARMVQQNIMMTLSPFERTVLLLHLEDMPYTRIAQILGKTPKSVDNALNRIKNKVTKILR